MEYFPCLVVLENVEQHDYVYIVEAKSYIRFWGVWPDDDPAKRPIRIDDVAQIHSSPSRLPVRLARQMYTLGGIRSASREWAAASLRFSLATARANRTALET